MVWRKRYFAEDNATPPFHYKILDHYFGSPSYIKPVKAFRGSSKTTNSAYVALHRVENPKSRYTLIVSDTASQAESIVADISDMVDNSLVPYAVRRSVQGELELEYRGKRYFIVGKGAGASMRGIKRNRRRPDLIVLDDIVNDELVMNRVRVDRLNRWFYGALLPSLAPDGEIYAVGTPLSRNDLFMKLCEQHPTVEIPLEPGVWPDRFSDEWIEKRRAEYRDAGMISEWLREYELKLTSPETGIFDTSRIRTAGRGDIPSDCWWVCALDGAFSEKESADYSAFAVVGIDANGSWWVVPKQMRGTTDAVLDGLFSLHSMYGFDTVGIEKGSFRLALKPEMDRRMLDYQQWMNVEELSVAGSKISRIKALVPVVNSGRLTIVDTGDDAEALMEQLELCDSEACRAVNDDLVDALSSVCRMEAIRFMSGGSGSVVPFDDAYGDEESAVTAETGGWPFEDKTRRDYD